MVPNLPKAKTVQRGNHRAIQHQQLIGNEGIRGIFFQGLG
jgi:hypothetical protein